MRLIDADALLDDIRSHSESYFADDFAREWVDKQPTVDAVPINWIDSWCVLTDNEDGVIDVMVADWRRENE